MAAMVPARRNSHARDSYSNCGDGERDMVHSLTPERLSKQAASPAATGPGGAHFEAKAGAHYLLALLLDAEPRGLPTA